MIDLSIPDLDKAVETIQEFIAGEVERAGCERAVLGMSGGLDSSLVVTLAARALGGERVLGLLIPDDEVPSARDTKDAKELAEALEIEYKLILIDKLMEPFRFQLKEIGLGDPQGDRVAWGNLKARIRMVLNYRAANSADGLVLGTSNRTEIILGYFTKYGDGGADILPIGHLYKTQVRELAHHVSLPKQIIEKVPSAGLWPGQTDEEELGASYIIIDQVLYCLVDREMPAEEASKELEVDERLIYDLKERMARTEHKRRRPPTPQTTF